MFEIPDPDGNASVQSKEIVDLLAAVSRFAKTKNCPTYLKAAHVAAKASER